MRLPAVRSRRINLGATKSDGVPTLRMEGREISYSIIRGTGRKYTYLRFGPGPVLEIVIPRGVTVDVKALLETRQSWILGRLLTLSNGQVLSKDSVMFKGERLRIVFQRTSGEESLAQNRDSVIIRAADERSIPELVRRWFLAESSAYAIGELRRMAERFGVEYRRADVREIKNWGYCTRDKRVTFSWQLAALPDRLREYVLLHELAHLTEFNHSRRFKRRLAVLCPDYRARERELAKVVPCSPLTLE